MHISTQTYLSPYGEITLGSFDTRLCLCNWSDKKNKTAVENRLKKYLEVNNFIQSSNALLTTAAEQLDAYFKSKLTHFDLPLHTGRHQISRNRFGGPYKPSPMVTPPAI